MVRDRQNGCCLGTFGGGCLIPSLLVGYIILTATVSDLGSLFFWIIFSVVLGFVGGCLGMLFAPKKPFDPKRHRLRMTDD